MKKYCRVRDPGEGFHLSRTDGKWAISRAAPQVGSMRLDFGLYVDGG